MKQTLFRFLFLALFLCSIRLSAQKHVAVISRCGGIDTVIIPNIVDNDKDGMDDALEQKLLNRFMPTIIQFNNESCPGPALDGTGDSNLVACHIYPYPQQYTISSSLDSVKTYPKALVPAKGLYAGLIWYKPLIMVNTAILYGKDCGSLGHNADVEGFSYSLKYIGADSVAGWMYDTIMSNWMGSTIQTTSHAATLCEQIETKPYKSALFPTGLDTVLVSPDKHGNYLTKGGCGASIICNPGCGGTPSRKNVKAVNIGEPNASLVADLGTIYAAYAGNDPWATTNFLSAQSGNAGAIRDKMIKPLTSAFIQGKALTTPEICPLYAQCYGPSGFAYQDYVCSNKVYNFYTQQLTTPGTYYKTFTDVKGCDSTIKLTLTVSPVSASSISVARCNGGSYNFNNKTLTVAGTYIDTITKANGCDSVVTLSLSFSAALAHSFSAAICSGETYSFQNKLLTAPGTYKDTITSSQGCDSVVTLSLTVYALPYATWPATKDTFYTNNAPTPLSGGNPTGGVYSGKGVNANTFYPDSAGVGIHAITYTYTEPISGCSDTVSKNFVVLLYSGISDLESEQSVLVYPNPAHNFLRIAYPQSIVIQSANLFDLHGRLIKPIATTHSGTIINVADLPQGIYVLQLISDRQVFRKRVEIE